MEKIMILSTFRSGIKDVSDLSLIRIFFGRTDTWLYKQIVATKWFEIVCKLKYSKVRGVVCV